MPVPSDPTTLTACAHAARMAGLRNATSISYAVYSYGPDWLESVKGQLWQASTHDKLNETTSVLVTTVGSRVLSVGLPSDFDHEVRLRAFDGAIEDRGVFQAAYSGSVQLAAVYSAVASDSLGRYVFTLAGNGAGQYRSIATYNDSTKMATLDSAWTTTPSATTTYVVGSRWWDLNKTELITGLVTTGRPERYRMIGTTTEVEPPSDMLYPILLFYGANLTRLNDGSYTFVRHLRERYAYWVQGLKVEAMNQFDDDRYGQQYEIWRGMLANYGGKNTQSDRMTFSR